MQRNAGLEQRAEVVVGEWTPTTTNPWEADATDDQGAWRTDVDPTFARVG